LNNCLKCGSADHLRDWAYPSGLKICDDCDESYFNKLKEAILKDCPDHFKDCLDDALDSFDVSDTETNALDVVWNLGDYIKEGSTFEYADFFNNQPPPTREDFLLIMANFNRVLDQDGVRYEAEREPMAWNFVSQLFKEGDN